MIEQISETLRSLRLDVEEVGGTLNVANGRGPSASKANIDPSSFIEKCNGDQGPEARRWVAGYASGVKSVLMEPPRSRARTWSFVESAGSVLPTIEARTFLDGVRDTCGEEPWHEEISDDLVLAWTMRLDHGMRVVTRKQFEEWKVSRDRVIAAARSLLFHMTRDAEWIDGDWPETVHGLRVGDGWDCGRLLVIEDVFFSQVGREWRYAIPEQGLLLAVSTVDAMEALQEVTRSRYLAAEYPLSDTLWKIEGGRPRLAS